MDMAESSKEMLTNKMHFMRKDILRMIVWMERD
jgi:hypothetical protein